MAETLETKICIWKINVELNDAKEITNYLECKSCDGHQITCEYYIGETVLAVIPRYDGRRRNEAKNKDTNKRA